MYFSTWSKYTGRKERAHSATARVHVGKIARIFIAVQRERERENERERERRQKGKRVVYLTNTFDSAREGASKRAQ